MIKFHDLSFDEKGFLSYMTHEGKQFFKNSPLWKVTCTDCEYTINDMDSFTHKSREDYIELMWKSEKIAVTVCIYYEEKYEFNISVKTVEDGVENVVFPIFDDVNSIANDDKNAYLLMPYQNGWLVKSPISTILEYDKDFPFWLGRFNHSYENEYPAGYSFQFFSYYDEDTFGCYFATEDEETFIKTMGVYQDGKSGLRYAVTNYPENARKTLQYVSPYNFVLTFFKGDWQDSADIYRTWTLGTNLVSKKLSEKALNPMLTNTDLWRINHTDFKLGMRTTEYLETCKVFKEKTDASLSLHWYGWNMGEHDVNYPEYISRERKAEGWEPLLTDWVEKIHENDIKVIPYVNARLWDSDRIAWKESTAIDSAIKDKNMNLLIEPWKKGLKPMCPTTMLWNGVVSDFSQYMQNHNFDGLYVDQVGSYNSTLCFDETHSHPTGGGTWWKDSYTQMMKNLRKKSGKGRLFTTESCCDAYLDVFDLFLVLDNTVTADLFFKCMSNDACEPVPLFSVLYSDYGQLYGSCARFSDSMNVFEFNYIRNILWGFMPTVEGGDLETVTNPDKQKYFDIIKTGVDFYKENKDLLTFGRLKRVLPADCEKVELDYEWGSKLYYESIIATLWEKDGEEYILLYNLSDKEQNYNGKNIPSHSFLKTKGE